MEIKTQLKDDRPLAIRYRPKRADEFVGQKNVWSPGKPLWELVHKERLRGLILWGPPGCGKTSFGRLLGHIVGQKVVELSAVEAGVKEIRAVIESSRENILLNDQAKHKACILFLDEIHRLSRNQQDVLLPALENGDIRLIGATTENPSFTVNNALLSRCFTVGFTPIEDEDVAVHLVRIAALEGISLCQETSLSIARAAGGDMRAALNLLESILSVLPSGQKVTLEYVAPYLQMIARHYDRKSDFHYELISAFIKSIRGGDPHAAVYYLARMLKGGEDPLFIARRLVICASEDIGNAHPTGLVIAQSALAAVREIGMPEARIILSQVATYLALSPKSNRSYLAIGEAYAEVEVSGDLPVPLSLRNASTAFLKGQGYGQGYVYAHSDPPGAAKMNYLPNEIRTRVFYRPSDVGSEKVLADFLKKRQGEDPVSI